MGSRDTRLGRARSQGAIRRILIGLATALLVLVALASTLTRSSASPSLYQYWILNPRIASGDLQVMSLSDGNSIQVGSTTEFLDRYATASVSAGASLNAGVSISGRGPFTLGSEVNAVDLPVPARFLGTAFVLPHYRDRHTYYLFSPNADANVTVQLGAASSPVAVPKGQVVTFDAGSDNTISGIVRSDQPIVVAHLALAGTSPEDAYPVPPAGRELWGIRTGTVLIGALDDGTTVTVYASDGTSVPYALNAGDRTLVGVGTATSQGQGSALRIVADKPVAAIQAADSDGTDATAFFDTAYLGSRYGIPVATQYLALACPKSAAITLHDGSNTPVTQNCVGDGTHPGKVYFGSAANGAAIGAGAYVESTEPVYLLQEASTTNDEHNLLGQKEAYYILNKRFLNYPLEVTSLVDGNRIELGGTLLSLDRDQSGEIPAADVVRGGELRGTAAFSVGSSADATDTPVPEAFFGTEFVLPHYRYEQTYTFFSPYGDATATVQLGTQTQQVSVPQGQVVDYDAGSDTTLSGVVHSDRPILVSHLAGTNADAYPVPPAALELWGVRSNNAMVTAAEDSTFVAVLSSDGQLTTFMLDAGERHDVVGAAASQGRGVGLHVFATHPVAGIQIADGDGTDATAFLSREYLGTRYVVPVATQYIAVVCTEPDTTVALYQGANPPNVQSCDGDPAYSGKVYFGSATNGANIVAGARLESDKPVYAIYEASATDDERNLLGHTISEPVRPKQPILNSVSGTTRSATYTLSGTASPGVSVQLYLNDALVNTTVAAGGVFTFDVPLTEGRNKLYTIAGDAGNTSLPSSVRNIEYIPAGRLTYYVVDQNLANTDIQVVSLADGNTVYAGGVTLNVNRYESRTIPGSELSAGSVIWSHGPISLGNAVTGTDMPVPGSFSSTTFVIPHFRDTQLYQLLSPDADAHVHIQAGTGTWDLTLTQGVPRSFSPGTDTTVSGIITSDVPILVNHATTEKHDAYPVPPAAKDLWGVFSGTVRLGAAADNTTVTAYSSDGAQQTYTLSAGQAISVGVGANTSQGQGAALHLVADKPIAAMQGADGDGTEASGFWDTAFVGDRFGLPVDTQYIAVVCPQANTTVTLYDGAATPVAQTCNGNGTVPGKAYFGGATNDINIHAGAYLESNRPIYVMYEASATNAEHNLIGQVAPLIVGPDAPSIDTLASPTTANPLPVTGTATPGIEVRLYVNGARQGSVSANGTDGKFTIPAVLNDGVNDIHVTAWDGTNEGLPSATEYVEYQNTISRDQTDATITQDTVWSPGSVATPYVVTGQLTVAPDATLTILPGAEVRFNAGSKLVVNGSLVVQGSDGGGALFTSNAANKAIGDWNGIYVGSASGAVSIDRATIRYAIYGVEFDGAGQGQSVTSSTFEFCGGAGLWAGIYVHGGASPTISGNTIRLSGNYGAGIYVKDTGSSPSILGNRISDQQYGVYVGPRATPNISGGNEITGNVNGVWVQGDGRNVAWDPNPVITGNSIYSNSTMNLVAWFFTDPVHTRIDARGNWWGSEKPWDIAASISDYSDAQDHAPVVDFSDFLDGAGGGVVAGNYLNGPLTASKTLSANTTYVMIGRVEIPAGMKLTVPEGVTLAMGAKEAVVAVAGDLDIKGQAGAPVTLAPGWDNPQAGDYRDAIYVGSGAGVVSIDHALISYAQYCVEFDDSGSAGSVSNSTFEHCAGPTGYGGSAVYIHGLSTGASPEIANNVIRLGDSNSGGIQVGYQGSSPTIQGNTISGYKYGIYVYAGASPQVVAGNEITGNSYGIYVYGTNSTATDGNPVVTGNSIYDNASANFWAENFANPASSHLDAKGNWWGTAEPTAIAPTINDYSDNPADSPVVNFGDFLNGPGGTPVPGNYLSGLLPSGTVLSAGASYDVLGRIDIPSGMTLTVPPGVTFRFDATNAGVFVDGGLDVQGTADSPVTFTSGRIAPGPRAWAGISVSAGASAVTVDHAVIEYADKGLDFGAANGSVTNSLIQINDTGVYVHGSGALTLSGNTIVRNRYGVAVYGTGNDATNPHPVITGNDLYSNGPLNDGSDALTVSNFGATSAAILDATGNWWGRAVPVAGVEISGQYKLVNFGSAAAPPLQAPTLTDSSIAERYFSPNADGSKDGTQFSASLTAPAEWTVEVRNASGAVVRSYSGSGSAVSVSWDGRDSGGVVVPDGRYVFVVRTVSGVHVAINGQRPVVVDTVAPSAGTVSIQEPPVINFTDISVQLAAAGVVEMLVSPNSDFSGASWAPYATSAPVTIGPSDGVYTVYAKFRDAAGNATSVATSQVVLDRSPPVVTISSPAEGAIIH